MDIKLETVKPDEKIKDLGVIYVSLTQEVMMLHFHLDVYSVLGAVR